MKKHNPVVKKSFNHWARMFRFMRGYDGEMYDGEIINFCWEKADQYIDMYSAIEEIPKSNDCALCCKYYGYNCPNCPIRINTNRNCSDNKSVWAKVIKSTTKKEWLTSAMEMIRLLFDLRDWEDK